MSILRVYSINIADIGHWMMQMNNNNNKNLGEKKISLWIELQGIKKISTPFIPLYKKGACLIIKPVWKKKKTQHSSFFPPYQIFNCLILIIESLTKHVIVWEHSATGFHIKYYEPLFSVQIYFLQHDFQCLQLFSTLYIVYNMFNQYPLGIYLDDM